ncbi:MAG: cupin-like domain-containing protein, partial [Aquidulcibacter sp.]|nr:cupin-like domain-containing protein [Aquidulcibacter sp.]
IFQSDEDPMAHIPEPARGVFGPITPDSLAKIKTRLRQSLDSD